MKYFLQFISNQSRSCNAWNISIHEYSPVEDEKLHAGLNKNKNVLWAFLKSIFYFRIDSSSVLSPR